MNNVYNKDNQFFPSRNGTPQDPRMMRLSDKAKQLILEYEALRLMPYDDHHPDAKTRLIKHVPGATIGVGHLIPKNEFDRFVNGISHDEAMALFEQDLETKAIKPVQNMVKVKLTQNEFDALVMLCYNIGSENDTKHIGLYYSSVLKIINGESSGDLKASWYTYVKSQSRPMRGLAGRRVSEYNAYLKGIYKRVEVSKPDWKNGTWVNKY